MIICFTGHRPDKLPNKETGYNLPNPTYIKICQQLEKLLLSLKPEKCISGMALGWDQYAANICTKLGIPFDAYIPFLGQEKAWPEKSQIIYNNLLAKASNKVVICDGDYAAYKMQLRNEKMVDDADAIIACWNKSPGGTANCINYARSLNKKIIYINPGT